MTRESAAKESDIAASIIDVVLAQVNAVVDGG